MRLGSKEIEEVSEFKYLGSMMSVDRGMEAELTGRQQNLGEGWSV